MARVDNEGPTQSSVDAERAAKEADKKSRDAKLQESDRQSFGKLLSGQKNAKETAGQQAKTQAESKQAEHKGQAAHKGAADGARTAQMARGGVMQHAKVMEQAKGFQGALEGTQHKSAGDDKGRVTTRDAGKGKDKVESDDRQGELIKKADARRDADVDKARVEAREGQRPNAAIGSGGSSGGSAGGDNGTGKDDGSAAAAAAIQKSATTSPTEKAAAKHDVKQIPPEMLEKLVSTVYLAVTEKGLKEFQIELKDGVLKGAFLKISADNGKISLSFSGLDAQTKNLVESSKGDLMRRLEKKGLKLARLDVS